MHSVATIVQYVAKCNKRCMIRDEKRVFSHESGVESQKEKGKKRDRRFRNAACPGAICQGLLMRLEQPEDGICRIRFFKSGLGQGIWIVYKSGAGISLFGKNTLIRYLSRCLS